MVEEKFLQIDGNKIRYLESGDSKKTLVLIHGLGASAERWDQVIPLFADEFRVVVPDLIGFGYSDKPLVDYTTEFFSEFLENFLIASDIKRPNLIGSSLGGQIVADYATTHHQEIEKLILVSPSGTMEKSTPALDAYIMAALYPNEQSAKNAFELMEGSGHTSSYVGFDNWPPMYPTLVDLTPLVLLSKSSTCQKHPAPKVAFNSIKVNGYQIKTIC